MGDAIVTAPDLSDYIFYCSHFSSLAFTIEWRNLNKRNVAVIVEGRFREEGFHK